MSTPKKISGFPERLPAQRMVELKWEDIIRKHYESFGYTPLQTSVVEEVETLRAKGGDVDKEIFGVSRLTRDEGNDVDEVRLALRFDQTVPLARYVAQNYSNLQFPFKRYVVAKSYRGERAQSGRFREFTQADIDVIDHGSVSIEFDAEMPRIAHKILGEIGLPETVTHINNRKLMQGFYGGLGISNPMLAIQIVDKLDKIGEDGVRESLVSQMQLSEDAVQACLKLAKIKSSDTSFAFQVAALGISNDTLTEGLDELSYVIDALDDLPQGSIFADLSIARGLDYYTGTVYEGKFKAYSDFSTIYGGGRYDNLVGTYLNRNLPGVGISIGLTRIFAKLLEEGLINTKESSPTHVLIMRYEDSDMRSLRLIAEEMREKGTNVEVYHKAAKIGDQIGYANKRGIPFVLFPSIEPSKPHEIKDLSTKKQYPIDIYEWAVPAERQGHTSRIVTTQIPSIKPV